MYLTLELPLEIFKFEMAHDAPSIIVLSYNGVTSCMTSLRSRRISLSQDTKDNREGREDRGGGSEHVRICEDRESKVDVGGSDWWHEPDEHNGKAASAKEEKW